MTGLDIFNRCMALMGYNSSESESVAAEGMLSRMTEIINQIALDLNISGIADLSNEIAVETKLSDALCYGCAMLLALSEGDGTKNQIFTAIYNAKRAAALGKTACIEDIFPAPSDGGV